MSSSDEVKHQLTPEGKFTLWILLCELSVFVLFLVLGQPKVGLGVCICMAVFLTALRATWNLHGNSWYWGAVVIALVLQGPFNFNVPWSDHAFRGTALLPFGFLDLFVVWGCIKLTEKIMKRS
jgi:hypothetical protein